MLACLVFESLVVEVKTSLVQNEGGNAPRQGTAVKRATMRIMDCWERGWCFLFLEQWPDGTPHGIWLCSDCSDCIDRRPPALH